MAKLNVAAFERLLNELGREGWELVSAFDTNKVFGSSGEAISTFKRPRNSAGGD